MSEKPYTTTNGKPSVAFVLSTLRYGGIEQATLLAIRGLLARGYRVDLLLLDSSIDVQIAHWIPDEVALFAGNEYAGDKRMFTVPPPRPTHWLSDYLRLVWRAKYPASAKRLRECRLIADYITHRQPDIVMAASVVLRSLLAQYLLNQAPPIVPIMHALLNQRQYRLRLFRNAARMIIVSQGMIEGVRNMKFPPERIITIYNPVVIPEIATLKEQKPNHPWFSDGGAPIVLGCGRLSGEKNFGLLIRAFAHLNKTNPSRLIILGEGHLRGELEQMASDLGIADSVSLPGWVENPYAYMSRSQLFVVSSNRETMSLVLVEALACGCPCVSTNCPSGPPEILLNGEIGKLVPVGDDRALAEAMQQTLDNPPPKEQLTARGEYFSLDRATDGYEKLINEVIGEQHRGQSLADNV